MVARYKIHPQSGYNFPVLLRASPAGQIALHSNYTTLHAHPGPLPPLPPPPRLLPPETRFSLQDSLNGVRARAFLWKIPAEWARTYVRRGWACRAVEGKKNATLGRQGRGICPFRVSGSASASFLPGLTLFDGKRPSLFEERRGGWRRWIRTYVRTNPIGQQSNSFRRFLPFVFPSKGFFFPSSDSRSRRGGEGRTRGHSWKNKSLHEFLEHRHGWSSLRSSRGDPVSLG